MNGKGERFFYASATEADTKADVLRIGRKNEGTEGASIPASLRADAVEAERQLATVGASIMDAVRYYLAHAKPAGGQRTVQQTVTEFLAAKRNAGRKENYLSVQKYVLSNVFAGKFGTRKIHEIAAAEIDGGEAVGDAHPAQVFFRHSQPFRLRRPARLPPHKSHRADRKAECHGIFAGRADG